MRNAHSYILLDQVSHGIYEDYLKSKFDQNRDNINNGDGIKNENNLNK